MTWPSQGEIARVYVQRKQGCVIVLFVPSDRTRSQPYRILLRNSLRSDPSHRGAVETNTTTLATLRSVGVTRVAWADLTARDWAAFYPHLPASPEDIPGFWQTQHPVGWARVQSYNRPEASGRRRYVVLAQPGDYSANVHALADIRLTMDEATASVRRYLHRYACVRKPGVAIADPSHRLCEWVLTTAACIGEDACAAAWRCMSPETTDPAVIAEACVPGAGDYFRNAMAMPVAVRRLALDRLSQALHKVYAPSSVTPVISESRALHLC